MSKTRKLLADFDEILAKIDTKGDSLYKYWLDNHAEPIIKKWLEEHEYNIDSCRTERYVEYITKNFIDWITGGD